MDRRRVSTGPGQRQSLLVFLWSGPQLQLLTHDHQDPEVHVPGFSRKQGLGQPAELPLDVSALQPSSALPSAPVGHQRGAGKPLCSQLMDS